MKHAKIMGRIVLLFGIVMLMSFIPENFRDLFGDWQCEGLHYDKELMQDVGCLYEGQGTYHHHNSTWHWGFRHYIWMLMGLALFIYNAVIIIIEINKHNNE